MLHPAVDEDILDEMSAFLQNYLFEILIEMKGNVCKMEHFLSGDLSIQNFFPIFVFYFRIKTEILS